MEKNANHGGASALVDQPTHTSSPLRKANAWWRKGTTEKAKRWTYVISEGEVWIGRKSKSGQSFYWVHSSEVPGLDPANDAVFKQGLLT